MIEFRQTRGPFLAPDAMPQIGRYAAVHLFKRIERGASLLAQPEAQAFGSHLCGLGHGADDRFDVVQPVEGGIGSGQVLGRGFDGIPWNPPVFAVPFDFDAHPFAVGVAQFPALFVNAANLAVLALADIQRFAVAAVEVVNQTCGRWTTSRLEQAFVIPLAGGFDVDALGLNVIVCEV